MSKIFQLYWLPSDHPRQHFHRKIAQFLSLLHVSTSIRSIMCLLAIKFPLGIRKIIVTLQKVATNTFLDTDCLLSTTYFSFWTKVNIFSGWVRADKMFELGTLPHALLASWLLNSNKTRVMMEEICLDSGQLESAECMA